MNPPELHWTVYDFSQVNDEELFQRYTTLSTPDKRRAPGKSRANERSHWAGRIALSSLLQGNHLDASVSSNPDYGYLELQISSTSSQFSWYGSISHTESIAVAAISTTPVGIDVENKNRSVVSVLSKLVTSDELDTFRFLPIREKQWLIEPELLLWSGKEAFLKALGLGISGGLEAVQIDWNERPYSVIHGLQGPRSLKQPRISFLMHENYLISVCAEKGLFPIKRPLL